MLLNLAAIAAGFVLLVWSADRFVIGAAALARILGASSLLIGLTVVALGTSAPEIFVSLTAAINGNPGIAVGNALGSNITNVALVLGLTALIKPLTAGSGILRREFPVVMGISLFAWWLCADNNLTFTDGMMLLTATALLLCWLGWTATQQGDTPDPLTTELEAEIPSDMPLKHALLWLALGLILLPLSSQILVWGAVGLAQMWGVSDLIIGLTIIAIGTSLPELAASITSVLKNEADIAIGNVLGSNMFNLLVVLGIPGLISPGLLPDGALARDFPVMIVLTGALFLMCFSRSGQARINRVEASLLLGAFIAYEGMLYYTA